MRSLSLMGVTLPMALPLIPLAAIIIVALSHLLERRRTAFGAAGLAIDLRAGLGRLAAGERVEDCAHALLGEVLVIIVVDLDHWRIRAGAEALDLGQREQAVFGRVSLPESAQLASAQHVIRSAQHARRRSAHLYMEAADRRQVEHGVEGRDLEHVDRRHIEFASDELHDRKRQPSLRVRLRTNLPLGEVEERYGRRPLPPFRVTCDDLLRALCVLCRPLEAFPACADLRIVDDSALPGHQRSTSPNTTSMADSTAVTSASMWPFIMKSIACRCEKPVGRILQR